LLFFNDLDSSDYQEKQKLFIFVPYLVSTQTLQLSPE